MGSKYNPDCVVDHSAMPKWSRSSESLVTMPDWVVTMPESVVTINRNTQIVAFAYGDYSQAAVGLPDGAHANTGQPYAPDGLIARYDGLQGPDGLVWTNEGRWLSYANWEHYARSDLRDAEHAASLEG